MNALRLPRFDVPALKPKRMTLAAFCEWNSRCMEQLAAQGLLDRVRRQATRRPVSVRFRIE